LNKLFEDIFIILNWTLAVFDGCSRICHLERSEGSPLVRLEILRAKNALRTTAIFVESASFAKMANVQFKSIYFIVSCSTKKYRNEAKLAYLSEIKKLQRGIE